MRLSRPDACPAVFLTVLALVVRGRALRRRAKVWRRCRCRTRRSRQCNWSPPARTWRRSPGRAGAAGRGGGAAGRGNQFADLPAFCRVAASIKPSRESDIKMELWMPASGWNGKFVVPGNGGFAGTIAPAGLATNLRNGYAAATTDTGHEGGSGAFMMDHPERLTDFADRAIHETAAVGKTIVAAFYGNGPNRSYFNGCSTGGRQALTAAQRCPDDFDGIVAGAPAIYASKQSAGQLWIWNATHKTMRAC
jgi:hypothetical protein